MRVAAHTIIEKITYSILMTGEQFETFRSFAVVTLAQGTGHFLMQIPVPGVGYQERRCYISGGSWTMSESGGGYLVAFTLCVFPAT